MPSLITTYSTNILTTFSLAKAFTWLIFFSLHPTREQGNKEKIVKKYCQSIADFVCRNNAANFNTSDEISDVFLAFPTLSPKECIEEIETVRTRARRGAFKVL